MLKVKKITPIIIGALFISAGLGKLILHGTLAREIGEYQILPTIMLQFVAWLLPAFEMALGVWLITGWRQKAASLTACGLLTVFFLAKLSVVVRNIPIEDCSCLGTFLSLPLWASFLLNAAMILLLIFSYPKAQNSNMQYA